MPSWRWILVGSGPVPFPQSWSRKDPWQGREQVTAAPLALEPGMCYNRPLPTGGIWWAAPRCPSWGQKPQRSHREATEEHLAAWALCRAMPPP